MVVFELTMPNRGSWNGRWSQENSRHLIFKRNSDVPEKVIGKSFIYNWDDGWTACVKITKEPCSVVNHLRKINKGFCGYDWMVHSIIQCGEIIPPSC